MTLLAMDQGDGCRNLTSYTFPYRITQQLWGDVCCATMPCVSIDLAGKTEMTIPSAASNTFDIL